MNTSPSAAIDAKNKAVQLLRLMGLNPTISIHRDFGEFVLLLCLDYPLSPTITLPDKVSNHKLKYLNWN